MKSVEMPPKASDDAKHRHQSSIEASVKSSDLLDRALDAKITISARELLATSTEVRKQVKDLVSNKKVAANILEDAQVDSYLSSCFEIGNVSPHLDIGKNHIASAAASLPLRVIYPTFAPGIEPECVLDGGAQVVLMRRDIWEKLQVPMTTNKAIRMESANTGLTTTLGLIENHPVQLGAITIYLQIHVVEEASFEVLLGRPFFDITNCSEVSRVGGSHLIHIRDPKDGTPYVFPTQTRGDRAARTKEGQSVNFRE